MVHCRIESVQEYLDSMEHEDSESEEEEDLKDIETQMQALAPSESAPTDQIPSDKEDTSEEETESDSKLDIESVTDKVGISAWSGQHLCVFA